MIATNDDKRCADCGSVEHHIQKCPHFLSLAVDDRRKIVRDKRLCFNCLRGGHTVYECKSKSKCRSCHRSHNSLIHNSQPREVDQHEVAAPSSNIVNSPTEVTQQIALNTMVSHPEADSSRKLDSKRILPTALINVRDRDGGFVPCRVLLDTASEYSYITEDCIRRLGLPRGASRMKLSRIQSIKADPTRGHTFVHIESRLSRKSVDTFVHILGHITASLPRSTITSYDSTLFGNLDLADPHWNRSSPIDILLGADEVWDVLSMGKLENDQGKVIAISTIFGWVVTSGILPCEGHAPVTLLTLVDLDRSIRAFWEIEECSNISTKKDAESLIVEQHFATTHRRHNDGKYVVELPFKEDDVKFAETYDGALARFNATERRLSRNPDLRAQYVKFMQEYESLGHMQELSPDEIDVPDGRVYYLPHHPVVGSKLRVVFDGSFQDAAGSSLNSKLYIGPPIQRNLFAVCLRFRLYEFVFSADIIKMFRQIWVSQSHRNFQRILWRETPDKPLKHFQLCTVTYGTASAPFVSVRVLEQLAIDYNKSHPNASKILLEDFYVDDVLTGASSERQLVRYRDELVDLLQQAGFQLSKWVSNSDTLKQTDHNTPSFLKDDDNSTKVLGIHWYSDEDRIGYKICLGNPQRATKRTILSDVSRIFDPLGLVSPVVIKFKILFQELCLMNLGWDDPLPPDIAEVWMKYREDLRNLDKLRLPRFIPNVNTKITLHGFSDASLKAYSAVIYCLANDENGNIKLSLVASKTRVSPLKQISLPRLETDEIVLSWLSVQPITLNRGNRTAEILENLPRSAWGHVSSKENPADCASRGLMVDQFLSHDLWWSGPTFLKTSQQPQSDSSQATINNIEVEAEMKTTTTHSFTTRQHSTEHPLERTLANTSSWWKLLRITAYVRRFINLHVRKIKNPNKFLTFDEIAQAKITCLKMAQDYFSPERIKLQRGLNLDKSSQLTRLSAYIDELGLLRVGGRIRHSELADAVQHPIILPGKHRISKLVLEEQHVRHLHPGVSTLFVIIRQQYWIVGARNLIRQITHKCLNCFRQAQHATQQRMADLPAVRVRQAFPFQNTGCDYAGPFTLKLHSGRNARTSKGYICLFVCMVTSAIHLELSTDLSTECFLAALRRFMARRGKCSTIYSDNGKNFVGAKRVLNELYQQLQAEGHNEIIQATLAQEGIKWIFTPPYSPHWGGMWESGVRSVKLHLRRIIGNSILTYEQMHTLLAQVEAVVNSRPLGYAPDNETGYLSPSHFLIGRPTTMVPEGTLTDLNQNRLDYWQHVQCMYQGFWKQWSQEYLTSLQHRPKWCNDQPNIKIDDLVLVKEDRTPPSTWIIGRVMEVFPGDDGLIRVVKLKTNKSTMTRNITRIVKLPIC
ncbi:uncharacterized protein LOC135950722 [Calliphora vicina]|uniref:uncharacterized protein LOC135950722 n=1 Tax=Calliphora vicina TaxID=7373 RepID=UPI00325B166F